MNLEDYQKLQELCNEYCFEFYEDGETILNRTIGGKKNWKQDQKIWHTPFWGKFCNINNSSMGSHTYWKGHEEVIIETPLNILIFKGYDSNISFEIEILKKEE